MAAQFLRIDFVSDVACPWCVIGLHSLLKALDSLRGEVTAEVHLHPFELNPNMPPGGENALQHVQKKHGDGAERSAAVRQVIKDMGKEVGFAFNYGPDSRIWNTFDANRLLHWAGLEGKQLALKLALFKSNFTDQRCMSDHATLIAAAAQVGLAPDRAREVLTSGAFAYDVRLGEQWWRSRGIEAVPSIVVNQRWLIRGGQQQDVFEQALRDMARGEAKSA